MAPTKLSLSEKIALAATGNQEEEYPEDIEYETSAKVPEIDEEYDAFKPAARSALRTQNIQLLDEFDSRYSGEKVSRKKLTRADGLNSEKTVQKTESIFRDEESGGDDQDSEEEADDSEASSTNEDQLLSTENLSGEENETGDEEEDDASDESEEDEEMESGEEESDAEEEIGDVSGGMQTLSKRDKESEIEKGRAVLNQIRIWDSLLEVRIRLQKMLLDCNRLPHTELHQELITDISNSGHAGNLTEVIEKSQEATKLLMYELIRLQEIMSEKNTETQKEISKNANSFKTESKNPMDEEITSDEDENLDETENQVVSSSRKRKMDVTAEHDKAKKMKLEELTSRSDASFKTLIPYRNQTIQKWNDKTQFAGGKFNRKSTGQQISTLRQIEQILSNKERLLKRTQVKRSKYSVIGEQEVIPSEGDNNQETSEEVFDDDDFYHQLLRELIERKTNNVNDPTQLSRHWLELQKLRTKLKKKVDTKASKGRKIRYDVHSKLVNFMAPDDNCSMSATAMKELFGSLFGKTKE